MRIISGSAGGRKIKAPKSIDIKPTSERVKESIFNIIQFDIEGRRVLDLFAGTGQLGIEALSRGAASAVFVDSSSESTKLTRENLRRCGFTDTALVYNTEALRYLEYEEKFDLIFIDPPYDSELLEKAISKILEFDKLRENGIIICETRASTPTPGIKAPYELARRYNYGGTELLKITRNGE